MGICFNDSHKMGQRSETTLCLKTKLTLFNAGFALPLVDVDYNMRGGAVLSGGATNMDEMDAAPVLTQEAAPMHSFGASTGDAVRWEMGDGDGVPLYMYILHVYIQYT